MTTTQPHFLSLVGFFSLVIVISQLWTGALLSFSLIPESMMIAMVRDEEDIENLKLDDIFWLHERGVDLAFIFIFIHFFRKLYLYVFDIEQASAWKSGSWVFLIFQLVVFCGLVLCCTHLSEITLVIAVNILHTFFVFKTKIYWWLFTDKQLNTDTIIRLTYAHYVSGFFMFYLAVLHAIEMHHDWKNENTNDGKEMEFLWWDVIFSYEVVNFSAAVLFFTGICWRWFESQEALSYEIFMWGDVGLVSDIRYFGVAPHWYFRPFMAWLIACPYHKVGIFGLILFFFAVYFQPNLHGSSDQSNYDYRTTLMHIWKLMKKYLFFTSNYNTGWNVYYSFFFFLFLSFAMYTTASLPYGRFYNRLGGNIGMLLAYSFVFSYLVFTIFRRFLFIEALFMYIFSKIQFLVGVETTIIGQRG